MLEHPALRLYRERYAEEVRLKAGGWTCSTRFVAGAASRLAATHDAMMAKSGASRTSSTLPLWEGQTAEGSLGRGHP